MKNIKKIFSLLFVSLALATVCSCSNDENLNKEINITENIVDDFIKNVNEIETVSLESKDKLNLCIMLYSCLEETAINELENEKVIAAKQKLDEYVTEYNTLSQKQESADKDASLILAFVSKVELLPTVDSVSLEDLAKILEAEAVYNALTQSIKENASVVAKKAILDSVRLEYDLVSNLDTDAYNAHRYIVEVNKLKPTNEITITDLSDIEKIVALYNSLTLEHKESEAVANAKAKLDTYETKINELKQNQAKATEFIMAVFSLPTGSALKYQNEEQRLKIDAAYTLYNALTDFEKTIVGVSDAYTEVNVIKATYENLKEPYDINKITPTNLCLYYYDGPKKLTFASGKDPISVLINDYGLTKENIKDNVVIYLDLYIEGGAVKGSPLYSFDITDGYQVTVTDVYNKLIELRDAGNEAIKAQGYTFTIHIKSLNDEYADSEYSNFFSSGNYPLA
jgi:hypothetical protein